MNVLEFELNKDEFINKIYKEKCIGYEYIPSILPAVKRLIVLGDIHGDLKLFKQLLQIANVVGTNKKGKLIWTGGSTYVVQVGDQIDRCRPIGNIQCTSTYATLNDEASDIEIMNIANELHSQASKVGGAFISLLGNHEILNANGIMTYVSYLGRQQFDDYKDPNNPSLKFKDGTEARIHAFTPGNEIGKMMGCTRLPAVIVGAHLFVHAGIVDGLIEELGLYESDDLETINVSIRMWLLGLLKKKYVKNIIKSSKNSMFWTRILGNIPPNVSLENPSCVNHIGKVLNLFKIGSIVIGHTPQSFMYSDDINQTCSGKIWRVDNGSSGAFHRFDTDFISNGAIKYSRRPQVLEIINDKEYFILDGIHCKQVNISASK